MKDGHVELIVTQLEESKRLMDTGEIPHLRLAFLLLDNAVELSMKLIIESKLVYNDMQINTIEIYERLQDISDARKKSEIKEKIAELKASTVSKAKLRRIESNYDEKVNFLTQREVFDEAMAKTVKKLHAYRNETYHRDVVPRDSIRPATIVLFDVACHIFSKVDDWGMALPLPKHVIEIKQRYETPGSAFSGHSLPRTVGENLRSQLSIDFNAVRTALATHLLSRIQQVEKDLEFIGDNFGSSLDRDAIIKIVQYDEYSPDVTLKDVLAARSHINADSFCRWKERIKKLSRENNRHRMFSRFAAIEDDFEPFEKRVVDVVLELDRHISLQTDIARGK
jgi:hypothetical protein